MIIIVWIAEFFLESAGAITNFKRSRLLSFVLSVVALMDVITFVIFRYWPDIYAWANWSRHYTRNLMFIWLACMICGEFASERRKSTAIISTAFLSVSAVAMACVFGLMADGLKERLLNGEIAAMGMLLGIVLLGWIGRRDKLSANWKRITMGFIVMVGGDLIFTLLWYVWDGARFWYPISTIAAQAIWAFGPMLPHKLCHARVGLGQRIDAADEVSVC